MTFFISARHLGDIPRELNPTIEVGDPLALLANS